MGLLVSLKERGFKTLNIVIIIAFLPWKRIHRMLSFSE